MRGAHPARVGTKVVALGAALAALGLLPTLADGRQAAQKHRQRAAVRQETPLRLRPTAAPVVTMRVAGKVPARAVRGTLKLIEAANDWYKATGRVPCDGCDLRPPGSSILWTYYTDQGFYPNWVRAARELRHHLVTRDHTGFRHGVKEIISYSVVKLDPTGHRFRVNESAYHAPDGEPPPWRDAMGTSLVLQLVVPALPERPTRAQMTFARTVATQYLRAFSVSWRNDGLSLGHPEHGRWYLEYAYRHGTEMRVLNGFMQTLVSLNHFASQAGRLCLTNASWCVLRDRAHNRVIEGSRTLLGWLPRYDLGPGRSRYSLTRPGPAPEIYHHYHRMLLGKLARLPYLPAHWRKRFEMLRIHWGQKPLAAPAPV